MNGKKTVSGEYRQIFPALFSVTGVLFWFGVHYDTLITERNDPVKDDILMQERMGRVAGITS